MKSDKVDEYLSPICDTAFLVAGLRYRDYETNNISQDKYGGIFAGEGGLKYADVMIERVPLFKSMSFMAFRCKWIDECTKKYCEKYDIKQVLILASGFDTRVYRLEISSNPKFFEVDTESIIEYKLKTAEDNGIKPIYRLSSIIHDLRDPGLEDKLFSNEFDPTLRTFVIIEGLFEYLTTDDRIKLLNQVGGIIPSGSFVICTTPSSNMVEKDGSIFCKSIDVIRESNAIMVAGIDDPYEEVLKPSGFKLSECHHTMQRDYWVGVDMSNPVVKDFIEEHVGKFEKTGEGKRQQIYIGEKL